MKISMELKCGKHDFGDTTLGEYLKSQVLSQLGQMKSMVYLAEQREITLPEEDQQKAQRRQRNILLRWMRQK